MFSDFEALADLRCPLPDIFAKAIDVALVDLKNGESSKDFMSLCVVNFIIFANREEYKPSEIKNFLNFLKNDVYGDNENSDVFSYEVFEDFDY